MQTFGEQQLALQRFQHRAIVRNGAVTLMKFREIFSAKNKTKNVH